MQQKQRNATEATETRPGKNKPSERLPLPVAIGVYIITILTFLPLYAIADESDSMIPNFCGLAYLGMLIALGSTRFGRIWSILVELSTKRLFR